MERFFWVDIHYAYFGMVARDGIVAEVAPIVAWMIGKSLASIKPWLITKKAVVKEIGGITKKR